MLQISSNESINKFENLLQEVAKGEESSSTACKIFKAVSAVHDEAKDEREE